MKPIEKKILYLIVFMLFGMIYMIQLRTVSKNKNTVDYAKYYNDLESQLTSEREKSRSLKKMIDDINSEQDMYLKQNLERKNDSLLTEWENIRFMAGLTGVKGKGLIINVTDKKVQTNQPENFIVHDEDIVKLLNELKSAGAQALSVNDERILTFSEIVCTGPTIQINKSRHPAPFEIKAIGDKDVMFSVLNGSDMMVDLMRFIKIQIEKNDNIVIPAFKGNIKRYITGLEADEK
jgi:uncharacterized protein YlxW (UPF0749 family)